ncbi:Hypothetical predicted protein [Octopus vulgaris]|uniref:Uncharacterized protein n=1 Tax=Octopus vulgaris TaxID=6645 RepID=A0AA36FIR4_OCTVU|nr:Hypothetical predicted protein [Octopus vulgaris]
MPIRPHIKTLDNIIENYCGKVDEDEEDKKQKEPRSLCDPEIPQENGSPTPVNDQPATAETQQVGSTVQLPPPPVRGAKIMANSEREIAETEIREPKPSSDLESDTDKRKPVARRIIVAPSLEAGAVKETLNFAAAAGEKKTEICLENLDALEQGPDQRPK